MIKTAKNGARVILPVAAFGIPKLLISYTIQGMIEAIGILVKDSF